MGGAALATKMVTLASKECGVAVLSHSVGEKDRGRKAHGLEGFPETKHRVPPEPPLEGEVLVVGGDGIAQLLLAGQAQLLEQPPEGNEEQAEAEYGQGMGHDI